MCSRDRYHAAMWALIMNMTYTWRALHRILMMVLTTKENKTVMASPNRYESKTVRYCYKSSKEEERSDGGSEVDDGHRAETLDSDEQNSYSEFFNYDSSGEEKKRLQSVGGMPSQHKRHILAWMEMTRYILSLCGSTTRNRRKCFKIQSVVSRGTGEAIQVQNIQEKELNIQPHNRFR